MARWHSPMLSHYAGLAPLRAITSEFRKRLPTAWGAVGHAPVGQSDISEQLRAMTATLASLVEEEQRLEVTVAKLQGSLRPTPYVVNTASSRWHLDHEANFAYMPLT